MSGRVRPRTFSLSRLIVPVATALALSALGGCEAEEEKPAQGPSGVDNPTDWSAQNALMTAPAKPTRTIAAMMFDIGGGAPNATTIMNVIGGTGSSQRHMYQEISYGIQ